MTQNIYFFVYFYAIFCLIIYISHKITQHYYASLGVSRPEKISDFLIGLLLIVVEKLLDFL